MSIRTLKHQVIWDKIAIGLSIACLAHCFLLPILLLFTLTAPWLESVHESFHHGALYLAIPSSLLAVWFGFKTHGKWWLILPALIGIGFLISALSANHFWETSLTVIGVLCILATHFYNLRLKKSNLSAL